MASPVASQSIHRSAQWAAGYVAKIAENGCGIRNLFHPGDLFEFLTFALCLLKIPAPFLPSMMN